MNKKIIDKINRAMNPNNSPANWIVWLLSAAAVVFAVLLACGQCRYF